MSIVKIGWGSRIILLYLSFMALIITLVVRSMHQDIDLVSRDYYNEELRFQDIIDASSNQAGLSKPVLMKLQDGTMQMQFPDEFNRDMARGKLHFYSQANAAWDRTFDLNIVKGHCTISVKELAPANYLAKLTWTAGGKSYYQETTIQIHP
jgi:hypothetical protein